MVRYSLLYSNHLAVLLPLILALFLHSLFLETTDAHAILPSWLLMACPNNQSQSDFSVGAGEELVLKAEKAVQKALADTNVYIKIAPDALESVIRDGRFKTAFELIEKDLSEVEIRRKAETLLYGYPENLPTNKRPVSGFLASDDDLEDAPLMQDPRAYGSIRVRLKRSVKAKASFTLNDSLTAPPPRERGSETSWQPSALLDLNVASLVSLTDDTPELRKQRVEQFAKIKSSKDIGALKDDVYRYNYYMEIGLHGGVSANQIEAIIYTDSSPSASVLEWAKKNDVEVKNG